MVCASGLDYQVVPATLAPFALRPACYACNKVLVSKFQEVLVPDGDVHIPIVKRVALSGLTHQSNEQHTPINGIDGSKSSPRRKVAE